MSSSSTPSTPRGAPGHLHVAFEGVQVGNSTDSPVLRHSYHSSATCCSEGGSGVPVYAHSLLF